MNVALSNQRPSLAPARADKPHVLFVIDELVFPYGGAEEMLIRLADHLPRCGYRVSIVTFRSDHKRDHEFGGAVRVLPLGKTLGMNAIRVGQALWRMVRAERVDIVQTFFNTSDTWAAPICRAAGCRAIVSSRRDMGILRRAKHRIAYRLLARSFAKVLAVSEQVRSEMIRADRLPAEKVEVVYNGIDPIATMDRRLARQKLGLPADAVVICSVGHIRPVKGFDILIAAAKMVIRTSPNVKFIIAGGELDAVYAKNLRETVKDSDLASSFLFAGPVYPPDVVYSAADIFCLPSRSEGLSHALLEAMSAGLPSVVTDVGGNPECVEEGGSGLVVSSEDADALASALMRVVEDPELRMRLGANARQRVAEVFSVRAMIDRHVAIYESLLARGTR